MATGAAEFDHDLVRKYPRSNRRIPIEVRQYGLAVSTNDEDKGQSVHISPFGLEFHSYREYALGALLKIHVAIPDYWTRKQRFVEYGRVDTPDKFKILAKVIQSQDVGKRGKKKLVMVQTVNMDDIDEQVLKAFLQDG